MTRTRSKPALVVGLDPSLTNTGVAFPDGSTTTLATYRDGWDRVCEILRQLKSVLDQSRATHVCMEGAFIMPKHIQGAMGLIELSGHMKMLILSRGLPIVLVPPTTLKLYASGKGNANKAFVMKEIKRRWAKSFVSSDRADAFALQQFGVDYLASHKQLRLRGKGLLNYETVGEARALGKAELIEVPGMKSFAKFG